MNGILPAPSTSMPQVVRSACRSGDSAAMAARGLANRPKTVGATTVPMPAANPCARKSRRVTGRLCASSCRIGSSSARLPGGALRMIIVPCLRIVACGHGQCTRVTALPSSAAQLAFTMVSVRPAGSCRRRTTSRVIRLSSSVRTSAAVGLGRDVLRHHAARSARRARSPRPRRRERRRRARARSRSRGSTPLRAPGSSTSASQYWIASCAIATGCAETNVSMLSMVGSGCLTCS